MKITFLLLIALLTNYGYTQSWDWVNYTFGNGANHAYYDLELTNDNNYILGVGRYRSSAIFYGQDTNVVYPLYSGSRDVFLTKVDTAGNYEWVVTDGGAGNDFAEGVAVDEFDNIYVVGTTSDSAYYGNIGILSDPSGSGAVLVAKYDSNGNIIWAKSYDGDGWDFAMEVECDKNGYIYVAGYQSGNFVYDVGDTLFDSGYFIMKLDYNGNVQYCKGPSNAATNSYSVINSMELHQGNLYFGGRVKSSVNFDSHAIVAPTWDDMFFAKMDTTGVIDWVRSAGGIYYTDCQDIVVKDNSIYVAGSYSGSANFAGISVVSAYTGTGGQAAFNGRDAYIAKYNSDGTVCSWVVDEKSLLLDVNYNILIDKANNIVVTGAYAEDNIYSSNASEGDLKVKAYDTNGVFQWELFPTGTYKGEGIIMKEDTYGNYYFGGRVKGSYQFDINNTVPAPVGKFASVIAKAYPPLDFNISNLEACTNDSVLVAIQNKYGHPLNYTWYANGLPIGNNDSVMFLSNNIDTVYCVVSNETEIDTAYFIVSENNLPLVSLGNDTTICSNNPSIMLSANAGFNTYQWNSSPIDTGNNYQTTQSGLYWVDVVDSNLCANSDSIYVQFYALPSVDLGQDILVCENQDSVQIGIVSTPNIQQFLWSPNYINSTASYTYVNQSDNYILTITDTNNCVNADTVSVTFLPLPNVFIGPDSTVCENNFPISLTADSNYFGYQWSTDINDTINTVAISAPGIYTLTVYNADGCAQTDTIAITSLAIPSIDLGNDSTTCDYNLGIEIEADPGFTTYQWSTHANDTLSSVTVFQSGTYYLTVTNQDNCQNTDSIDISFIDCTAIESTETNEAFYIADNTVYFNNLEQDYSVTIYASTGQLIKSYTRPSTINISGYSSGLYIIYYSGEQTFTKKFFKQ
ncbi:MAG: T9SS type A sorting domain-containing protein [Putridiphycobacter sp.]|nr:T9SS type A sorting domain-containing protein [Putridiphycobacter sp.]